MHIAIVRGVVRCKSYAKKASASTASGVRPRQVGGLRRRECGHGGELVVGPALRQRRDTRTCQGVPWSPLHPGARPVTPPACVRLHLGWLQRWRRPQPRRNPALRWRGRRPPPAVRRNSRPHGLRPQSLCQCVFWAPATARGRPTGMGGAFRLAAAPFACCTCKNSPLPLTTTPSGRWGARYVSVGSAR